MDFVLDNYLFVGELVFLEDIYYCSYLQRRSG